MDHTEIQRCLLAGQTLVLRTTPEMHRRLAGGEPIENFASQLETNKTPEIEALKDFLKGFHVGQATIADFIEFQKRISPEFREHLLKMPGGEFFQLENLDILKQIAHLLTQKPGTPEQSVTAACLRFVLRLGFDPEIFKTVSAWIDIEEHHYLERPLRSDSLQLHDAHFKACGKFRIGPPSDQTPPAVVVERQHIGFKINDKFSSLWKRITLQNPEIRLENLLIDLQVPLLRRCILDHWIQLFPNIQPSVGLCDFEYKAIVEFCCCFLNVQDDSKVNYQNVYDAINCSELQLIRREPSSVTAFEVLSKNKIVEITHNGKQYKFPFSIFK